MKGEIRVAEFALANEPEEYEFTCTADSASGSADAQVRPGALLDILPFHLLLAMALYVGWHGCAGAGMPVFVTMHRLIAMPTHGIHWAHYKGGVKVAIAYSSLACRQTCGRQWRRSAGGCMRCWSSMWPSWGSCDARRRCLE